MLAGVAAIPELFPTLKSTAKIGRQPAGFFLLPTNQLLQPWGEQVAMKGRPVDAALDSSERLLAVLNSRGIDIFDAHSSAPLGSVKTKSSSYTGIAFRPGANEIWTGETSRNGPDYILITPVSPLGVPGPGAEIPLIQFQDVALTTAIENLARQAGLNYILDPKVPYGQPAAAGQPAIPQPNISIRWENLTAEQALSALLNVYSLQLVDDPKTKVSRITTKDPAAPDPLLTRVIQLKYAGVSNLISSVQTTLIDKRSKVVGDARTSQLVVVATEKELVSVEALVDRLDTQTRQVLIEARLMEISRSPSSLKGIDWSGTLQAQSFNFGNGGSQQASTVFQAPGAPTT